MHCQPSVTPHYLRKLNEPFAEIPAIRLDKEYLKGRKEQIKKWPAVV
ncbi:MAG TPA: hypothetical protein VK445_09600 [Dissulfurispiraceae bacterium]|nr:hypothetical protein [Dissulfurispiraceae bacterium]